MRAGLHRAIVPVALVVIGCGTAGRSAPDSPEPRDAPAAAHDPACAPDALPPLLESYDALTPDRRFTLELARDARGAWAPAAPLAMPLHHASTIDWQDRSALDTWRPDRARVVGVALGRTAIEHDARRGTWFATYAARIERICPASE